MKNSKKVFIGSIALFSIQNCHCSFERAGMETMKESIKEMGNVGTKLVKQFGKEMNGVISKNSGTFENIASCVGVKAVEKAGEVISGNAETFKEAASKVGVEAAKYLGVEAVKKFGEAGIAVVKQTGETMTDVINKSAEPMEVIASKVGVEAAKNLGVEAVEKVVQFGEKFVPIAWLAVGIYAFDTTYHVACDVKSALYPNQESVNKELYYAEVCEFLRSRKALRESLAKNANGERGVTGLPVACENDARRFILAGGAEELGAIIIAFKQWFPPC